MRVHDDVEYSDVDGVAAMLGMQLAYPHRWQT